jgi:hypothetical protein
MYTKPPPMDFSIAFPIFVLVFVIFAALYVFRKCLKEGSELTTGYYLVKEREENRLFLQKLNLPILLVQGEFKRSEINPEEVEDVVWDLPEKLRNQHFTQGLLFYFKDDLDITRICIGVAPF